MANKDDYLTYYREFFENFAQTVNPNDQLPVKLACYKIVNSEVVGSVIDWCTQYLSQKKCPPNLFAPIIKIIIEEVRKTCKKNPVNCGFNPADNAYDPLKLMHTVMAKTNEVCLRYLDNSMLCSLPSPDMGSPRFVTSVCSVKNTRRTMEDRHVIVHDLNTMFNIQEASPSSYYAIFDGHAGQDAATYGSAHLHQFLAENKNFVSNPKQALFDAFCKTDVFFIYKCKIENLNSGTTAVVALLRPKEKMLYVAWAGDSQALLVSRERTLQLVNPHKPCRDDERERIEKHGGCVMKWGTWRVNGQLAVSRSIGDPEHKPFVIAAPDIEEVLLDGDDFLVLACDGLWDTVSDEAVAKAVYNFIYENPVMTGNGCLEEDFLEEDLRHAVIRSHSAYFSKNGYNHHVKKIIYPKADDHLPEPYMNIVILEIRPPFSYHYTALTLITRPASEITSAIFKKRGRLILAGWRNTQISKKSSIKYNPFYLEEWHSENLTSCKDNLCRRTVQRTSECCKKAVFDQTGFESDVISGRALVGVRRLGPPVLLAFEVERVINQKHLTLFLDLGQTDFVGWLKKVVPTVFPKKQKCDRKDDTDRISQRLVQLAKEQGSTDNISVIVVFLREPSKIAAEAHWANRNVNTSTMEEGLNNANNPFGVANGATTDNIITQKTDGLMLNLSDKFKQNGTDLASPVDLFEKSNGKRPASEFDDDDFGPETNVDTVDDILSPGAKEGVSKSFADGFPSPNNNPLLEEGVFNPFMEHQEKAALEMEKNMRKRETRDEFDDEDRAAREETPTPPADAAHDVSGLVENQADSESEDEWNYIKGEEANKENLSPQPEKEVADIPEEDDTMSQLNPNAAEFVPVSPTRSIPSPVCRMLINDPIISQSPNKAKEIDINLPNPKEFENEVKLKPSEIDSCNNGLNENDSLDCCLRCSVFQMIPNKIKNNRLMEELTLNVPCPPKDHNTSKELMENILNGKNIDEIPEFQPGSTPKKVFQNEGFHFGPNAASFTTPKILDQSEALSTQAVFGDDTTATLDHSFNDSAILNKESDPMSMSFYAENPFDLNKVQQLPNNLDDFLNEPDDSMKDSTPDLEEYLALGDQNKSSKINNDDAIQVTDLDKHSFDDEEKELASPLEQDKELLSNEEIEATKTPEPTHENLLDGVIGLPEKRIEDDFELIPEDASEVTDLLKTGTETLPKDVELIPSDLLSSERSIVTDSLVNVLNLPPEPKIVETETPICDITYKTDLPLPQPRPICRLPVELYQNQEERTSPVNDAEKPDLIEEFQPHTILPGGCYVRTESKSSTCDLSESKSPLPEEPMSAGSEDFTRPEFLQQAQDKFDELCKPLESPQEDVTSSVKDDLSENTDSFIAKSPYEDKVINETLDERVSKDGESYVLEKEFAQDSLIEAIPPNDSHREELILADDISADPEQVVKICMFPPERLGPSKDVEEFIPSAVTTENASPDLIEPIAAGEEPSLNLFTAKPIICICPCPPKRIPYIKPDENIPFVVETENIAPEFAEPAVVTPSEESKTEDVVVGEDLNLAKSDPTNVGDKSISSPSLLPEKPNTATCERNELEFCQCDSSDIKGPSTVNVSKESSLNSTKKYKTFFDEEYNENIPKSSKNTAFEEYKSELITSLTAQVDRLFPGKFKSEITSCDFGSNKTKVKNLSPLSDSITCSSAQVHMDTIPQPITDEYNLLNSKIPPSKGGKENKMPELLAFVLAELHEDLRKNRLNGLSESDYKRLDLQTTEFLCDQLKYKFPGDDIASSKERAEAIGTSVEQYDNGENSEDNKTATSVSKDRSSIIEEKENDNLSAGHVLKKKSTSDFICTPPELYEKLESLLITKMSETFDKSEPSRLGDTSSKQKLDENDKNVKKLHPSSKSLIVSFQGSGSNDFKTLSDEHIESSVSSQESAGSPESPPIEPKPISQPAIDPSITNDITKSSVCALYDPKRKIIESSDIIAIGESKSKNLEQSLEEPQQKEGLLLEVTAIGAALAVATVAPLLTDLKAEEEKKPADKKKSLSAKKTPSKTTPVKNLTATTAKSLASPVTSKMSTPTPKSAAKTSPKVPAPKIGSAKPTSPTAAPKPSPRASLSRPTPTTKAPTAKPQPIPKTQPASKPTATKLTNGETKFNKPLTARKVLSEPTSKLITKSSASATSKPTSKVPKTNAAVKTAAPPTQTRPPTAPSRISSAAKKPATLTKMTNETTDQKDGAAKVPSTKPLASKVFPKPRLAPSSAPPKPKTLTMKTETKVQPDSQKQIKDSANKITAARNVIQRKVPASANTSTANTRTTTASARTITSARRVESKVSSARTTVTKSTTSTTKAPTGKKKSTETVNATLTKTTKIEKPKENGLPTVVTEEIRIVSNASRELNNSKNIADNEQPLLINVDKQEIDVSNKVDETSPDLIKDNSPVDNKIIETQQLIHANAD